MWTALPGESSQPLLLQTVWQFWWIREKLGGVRVASLGEEALYLYAVTALQWQGGRKIPVNRFNFFPHSTLLNWCTHEPTNTGSKHSLQSLGKSLAILSGLKVEIKLCFAHLGCKNILIVWNKRDLLSSWFLLPLRLLTVGLCFPVTLCPRE